MTLLSFCASTAFPLDSKSVIKEQSILNPKMIHIHICSDSGFWTGESAKSMLDANINNATNHILANSFKKEANCNGI